MKNISNISAICFCLFSLLLQSTSWAAFKATPEEAKMCNDTIYTRKVPGDPNWSHVHHYCDCIRFTNRAYMVMNKSKEDFKYNLGEAMGGCDYVTSHTTPDFKLLPEIYLQQGIIFSLQGKEARAAGEFVKAIEGNPKLDRAYINLARFYKRNKDTKNALEIITKGVMINPDSKALKRMYKELGGSLPLPVSTEAASTLAIDPKSPPAVENTIIMPPLEQKKEQHMGVKAEAKKNAVQLPTEQQQAPGSRANPWCRFCPDTPVKADPSPSNP